MTIIITIALAFVALGALALVAFEAEQSRRTTRRLIAGDGEQRLGLAHEFALERTELLEEIRKAHADGAAALAAAVNTAAAERGKLLNAVIAHADGMIYGQLERVSQEPLLAQVGATMTAEEVIAARRAEADAARSRGEPVDEDYAPVGTET